MVYDIAKQILKKPFHLVGLDLVRRAHEKETSNDEEREIPPLFDDPLEALAYEQGGRTAAYRCPIPATVMQNGLSYSPNGWHPFVATLHEYAAGNVIAYENSVLRRFYATYQPSHAAQAIAGFDQMPSAYMDYPAHVYRLAPWQSRNAEEADQGVRAWTEREGREHGNSVQNWSFDADGYQYHGPVSTRKGELEYERLISIYERLRDEGYSRSFGHACFVVLRRGDEYRFLQSGGGSHRTAAMSVLGHETIPARFRRPHVVDVEMAAYWPQVQRKVWSREDAIAYFNHLFDFDSRAWAADRELLAKKQVDLQRPGRDYVRCQ